MSLRLPESELIQFAKSVEVAATQFLDGYHSSTRGGSGVEFHGSLPYVEGDDTRSIDWKRFGASDRYFVNRFTKEERTGWTILIDSSESMRYGDKASWARLWAGALVFLARVWGDRFYLYPERDSSLEETFLLLSDGKGGVSDLSKTGESLVAGSRLVVFSDFFMDDKVLSKVIDRWRESYFSVHLVQVLDPRESQFSFTGVTEFLDLESPDKLVLDSAYVRRKYLRSLNQLQNQLSREIDRGSFTTVISSGEKLQDQLLKFFEGL